MMLSLDRRKRVLYLNQLCLRPFIIVLQPLLLLVIRHQNDAPFHDLYRNLLSGNKSCRAQPLAGKGIFGVDLSKTFGRNPTISERSVPDWSLSGAECKSAIINSLIVGEVSSRPVLRVPGGGVSISDYHVLRCVHGNR